MESRLTHLEELVDSERFQFYPSYRTGENLPRKGLFHYHVPRTGGVSFSSAVSKGLDVASRRFGGKVFSGRLGETDGRALLSEAEYFNVEPHNLSSVPCVFVQTEWAFGLHHTFRQCFELLTFVRNPLTQVPSYYGYRCRFDGCEPNSSDFERFVYENSCSNRVVRVLSGDGDSIGDQSVDKAIRNLDTHFEVIGTPSDIDSAIVWALSRYGAPNVLVPVMNKGKGPNVRATIDGVDDLVEDACALDIKVFEWVRENKKVPQLSHLRENAISDLTIVVSEFMDTEQGNPEDARIRVASLLVNTDWLVNRLGEQPTLLKRKTLAQDLASEKPPA